MPTALTYNSDVIKFAELANGADGPVLIARVKDEINLNNSPALRNDMLRLVEENEPTAAIINLGDVPYMDSSAIAVLVEILKAVRKQGDVVHLCGLQTRVRSLLAIARLDSIFTLSESEAEARTALGVPDEPQD